MSKQAEVEMDPIGETSEEKNLGPKDRKWSWARLRRVDSLNLEAGRVSISTHGHQANNSQVTWLTTFSLAFQSIGVVYGDIGTSPLYVFSSTFSTINDTQDVIGVLSLIIYTLLLLPMIKYIFIVLRANDNGDGGTFALYSLICRKVKVGLIPNQQAEDKMLSNYNLETSSKRLSQSEKVREKLEGSNIAKVVIFMITIADQQVLISCGIFVVLFMVQRFGTDKVGFSFAPIIMVWFMFISLIGLYNLFKHDIGVLRAFNPYYMIDYFKRNGRQGWTSLGGVFLCITGTEAMFADLGHFNMPAIQMSFSCVVFPALLMAYSGQAAYLMKFPQNVGRTFYDCIPSPFYWPTFVIAVAAAIIASQAMISGAFAIISQSLSLGCFPRVKVVHTSAKYEGQVYIPEVNYVLMVACVIVTIGFGNSTNIGNAYGVAVVSVMLITTCLLTLIMLVIWKTRIWWIVLFLLVFGSIEIVYMSANLYKFVKGGWFPIATASLLMIVMVVWHYVYRERYFYELNNKVSPEYIHDLVKNPRINRIPGMALLYTELVEGIPKILTHFVANVPSIHSVLVIVSVKNLPISKVVAEERNEHHLLEAADNNTPRLSFRKDNRVHIDNDPLQKQPDRVSSRISSSSSIQTVAEQERDSVEEEIKFVETAMEQGVVYLLGEAEVVAKPHSNIVKRIVVNYVYSFLRKNFRQGEKMMAIPHGKILRVGMTYEI
ncbi:hypothetical protein MLD38_040333 [Melastoma candidum]|uniref:Uncharacterized protein n=1 Tax=Melastoma candidum TaxID=119954 RepID=A0ACB9L5D3_9MYRT|nr:hypothetical protein MLD38_040333 [Melastoma candidum]